MVPIGSTLASVKVLQGEIRTYSLYQEGCIFLNVSLAFPTYNWVTEIWLCKTHSKMGHSFCCAEWINSLPRPFRLEILNTKPHLERTIRTLHVKNIVTILEGGRRLSVVMMNICPCPILPTFRVAFKISRLSYIGRPHDTGPTYCNYCSLFSSCTWM